MAKITDVARLAGVHPSTVSRVLRDDARHRTSVSTKARIRVAAEQLGYRPNALARALRTHRTQTVALLAPYLDNIGWVEITRGVLEGARAQRLRVLLMVVGEEDQERALRDFLGEGRVDGLLVAFLTVGDPRTAAIVDGGLPFVLLNRRAEGVRSSVSVDDAAAAAVAVDYLAGLGHRRFAHISGAPDTDTARRREEGFRRAVAARGLDPETALVAAGNYDEHGAAEAARLILRGSPPERPTAIVAADLVSGLGTLGALQALGVRVPGEVSVVALNDHFVASHTNPALTSVWMPHREMGIRAVHQLADVIETGEIQDVVIDQAPYIVVRNSTGPPPV